MLTLRGRWKTESRFHKPPRSCTWERPVWVSDNPSIGTHQQHAEHRCDQAREVESPLAPDDIYKETEAQRSDPDSVSTGAAEGTPALTRDLRWPW